MEKKGKVIPLFKQAGEAVDTQKPPEPLPISEEELEEVEKIIQETIMELEGEPVGKLELEIPDDWEDAIPREATVADWIEENCNELPVHESENGLIFVGVPLHTFDELLRMVVDSVNDYETMRSALERIAERGNELEAKIARDALASLSS